ncbi:PTS transporter subunit EIIC [Paenibacillus sp. S150]|uniref:PTS transporter subunit EIIC n=1 Tax=Paenibacillus sp. S150 TaxID=2749826 RepID=UPI001C586279|nr:PTS transporter subunit EIIC [Paenibacillus sp. S150]MBW4083677.1 PTS transporter subunit EIIC [Paenibacillus sp. S150]
MVKEDTKEKLALAVLETVGGEGNVAMVSHCYTRLRLTVNDPSAVDESKIRSIPGVLGSVIRGNEYQVVIGPDVSSVYLTFMTLGNFQADEDIMNTSDAEPVKKGEKKEEVKRVSLFVKLLDFIAGTFSPIIPVLIAGGLTGAVLTVLTSFFGVAADSGTYVVFSAVNQAAFYFLPVFIGFSAARKLNINPFLGAFLGVVLLFSTINGAEGLNFFGIPVHTTTYNTTVFPVLLAIGFMSVVYKFFDARLPKVIKTVLLPLLTIIITVPVTLIVLGPIGDIVGTYFSDGVYGLYNLAPPLAVLVIGAATPFLVFFGMNNALYPVLFAIFAAQNNDPLIVAGMLSANISVGAACLAVGLKAKNASTRSVGISAGVSGLLGITEPGVYGILFPLKRPLVAAVIGGGVGGLLCGFLKVAGYAVVSPSLASIVAFIPADGTMNNFYFALVVTAVSFIVAFAAAWVLGFEQDTDKQGNRVQRLDRKEELNGVTV